MQYLHDKQYYVDLYDKSTVSNCRWVENFHYNYKPEKKPKDQKEAKMAQGALRVALHYDLLFTTGERYLNREKTIQEWIDRDTVRQQRYDQTEAPVGIRCLSCNSLMEATFKTLYDLEEDREERVLFMYDCPQKCMPRRSFFDDGCEWERNPRTCKVCGGEVTLEDKSTKKKSVITETCKGCGNVEVDEYKFTSKEKEVDEKFEADRKRFCLSEEKGQEYIKTKQWFEDLKSFMEDIKEREEKKDEYEAVKKLHKLTLAQLEKLLVPLVEKEGYIKFVFDTPEMDSDVKVSFTASDDKDGRDEYTSRQQLKKVIQSALGDTNWHLMGDGISYRLGILSGRLLGYEREADLLKLVESKKKTV